MTTANKITISRILLVPFFVVQLIYYVNGGGGAYRLCAIICFAVVAGADAVDGCIARHYNQRSELGALLDPLADKLLLVSAIVILSIDSRQRFVQIPMWLVVTVVSRDVILLGGMAVIHYTAGKFVVRPRVAGKLATVFQMAAVLWTLLQWRPAALPFLTLGAGVFTGVSGLYYIVDGMRQMNAHPASAPTPRQDGDGPL